MIGALAALLAAPAADGGRWHFAFGQGVAEYSVGSFAPGGDSVALSCAEAGPNAGSVSIAVRRAGFVPAPATRATFRVGRERVTFVTDADGFVRFPRLAAAPDFAQLWGMLRRGDTLEVAFGPGRPLVFPLTGAAALLGPQVCPKQLADR